MRIDAASAVSGAQGSGERLKGDSPSEMFKAISNAGAGERVFVRDMLDVMQGRAFGMAALLFALPVCFPMPPGVPTVAGAALLIVSVQMVLGNRTLWMPRRITKLSISRTKLKSAVDRMTPRLLQLERAARPRLLFLTNALARQILGLVMTLLAVMLILPIPFFGNMPLGYAAAILAIGLIARDGYFVLAGVAATAAAVAITGSMAWLGVKALLRVV